MIKTEYPFIYLAPVMTEVVKWEMDSGKREEQSQEASTTVVASTSIDKIIVLLTNISLP